MIIVCPLMQVNKFMSAYDNTFVILGNSGKDDYGIKRSLIHADINGNIIKKYQPGYVSYISMINEREVIVNISKES